MLRAHTFRARRKSLRARLRMRVIFSGMYTSSYVLKKKALCKQ